MDSINKLIEIFEDFPGIGPRQAKRFVYFLLTRNANFLNSFGDNIKSLKNLINVCSSCQRFYQKDASQENVCSICRNVNRNKETLMVVSRDIDLEQMEKAHCFDGMYFVLGGTIPILEKEPERRIRAKELIAKIKDMQKNNLTEIIIATSLNPEGENTADYVEKIIKQELGDGIKITTLGRGLSTGTELEYSDSETLKNAIKNRQ